MNKQRQVKETRQCMQNYADNSQFSTFRSESFAVSPSLKLLSRGVVVTVWAAKAAKIQLWLTNQSSREINQPTGTINQPT